MSPPSDLSPEEVDYLLTQKVWMPGTLGGLFRLAKRGYLQFHGVLGGPDAPEESRVCPVELTPNGKRIFLDPAAGGDVPSHERLLISAVARGGEDPLMEIGRSLPTIEAEVSEQLACSGLLEASAQTVRNRYLRIASIVFLAGLILSLSAIYLPATFSVRGILIGTCLSAIPVAAIGRFMPRLTRQGAEERRRWQSFLESLRGQIEGSERRPIDSIQILDRFMEYAPLIPGIDFRPWMSRLGTRFAGVPYLPTWFVWYATPIGTSHPEHASFLDRGIPNLDPARAATTDFGFFARALTTNLRIRTRDGADGSGADGAGGLMGFFSGSGGGGFGGGGSSGGGGGGGGGAR